MDITISQLLTGAREARGIAVIIDVFRAFSTACYVMANGAREIIPVGDIEVARTLRADGKDRILMGERDGVKPVDFDYGNSPAEIHSVDFTGKTVIHTTSAGTQGLVNAAEADEVITGSFVNAEAIVAYILRQAPDVVSLVSMGTAGLEPNEEDDLCAQYLAARLENHHAVPHQIHDQLKSCAAAQNFFNPQVMWAPVEDFELCAAVDRFDFVLKADRADHGHLTLRRCF